MNNEKNSGFTLIELLAVIVILAIIALIATPIILNIIKDSKEESNKRSIEMYAKAIENSIIKYQMLSNQKINGAFLSTEDGRLLIQEGRDPLVIEYDGSKIFCSLVEIYDDGNIFLGNCIINEDETKSYNYGNKRYSNGEVVYFDVKEGTGCSESDYKEDNSNTGYNGITIIDEDQDGKDDKGRNGCLKFYAFNDDGGNKINLLLDHNTTKGISWYPRGSGSSTLISTLKSDTNEWEGTITPKNYEFVGNEYTYTIDYSQFKARLITMQEIAKITGADREIGWDNAYYFDSLNEKSSNSCTGSDKTNCKYGWLYNRTKDCVSYGCEVSDLSNYGYWTATSSVRIYSKGLYLVQCDGRLIYNFNAYYSDGGYGVRPVIEVLKEKLY